MAYPDVAAVTGTSAEVLGESGVDEFACLWHKDDRLRTSTLPAVRHAVLLLRSSGELFREKEDGTLDVNAKLREAFE